MMARNKGESDEINKIIKAFKAAMHPSTIDEVNRFWNYPDNFDIYLFSPTREYLFNISTCVLEKMDVNYAQAGVPSFFKDTGAPVDISMSLQFKELELLTREKIQKDGF